MFLDDLWPKSKIFAKFGILVGKWDYPNFYELAKISRYVAVFPTKLIRYVISDHFWRKKYDLSLLEALWSKILVYYAVLRHCAIYLNYCSSFPFLMTYFFYPIMNVQKNYFKFLFCCRQQNNFYKNILALKCKLTTSLNDSSLSANRQSAIVFMSSSSLELLRW